MPNFFVFNKPDAPVYTQMQNNVANPDVSTLPDSDAGRAGVLFSANGSASATVLLGLISAVVTIQLINPVNSGRTVFISRINGSIGGSSLLSAVSGSMAIIRGGTVGSPVSAAAVNNNLGQTGGSVITVQTSTSAVTGGAILTNVQMVPGVFSQNYSGSVVLPPGSTLSVNVISSSSTVGLTVTSTVNVNWWEN